MVTRYFGGGLPENCEDFRLWTVDSPAPAMFKGRLYLQTGYLTRISVQNM